MDMSTMMKLPWWIHFPPIFPSISLRKLQGWSWYRRPSHHAPMRSRVEPVPGAAGWCHTCNGFILILCFGSPNSSAFALSRMAWKSLLPHWRYLWQMWQWLRTPSITKSPKSPSNAQPYFPQIIPVSIRAYHHQSDGKGKTMILP